MRKLAFALLLLSASAFAEQKPLKVPDGFHVDVFAKDLENPRMLLTLDDGTVLVSRPKTNDVIALRDRDGDGRADEMRTAVAHVARAHGLAMRGNTLYVAGVKKIVAAERLPDGSFAEPHDVVTDLPDGGQHPNRTLGFGPDGKLYVSIGSTCNDCTESNPEHATLLQFDPDGSNRRIYARGLRNMLGFDWNPATGELWGSDNGSDWRGDNLPPEELNRVSDGLHYGWPLCFGVKVIDETGGDPEGTTKKKFCESSEAAALELPSHSAPIGFTFYRGKQFPAGYRNDAFSIWRGSWNREAPREPKVVRIKFASGKPSGYEDFVTGFLMEDGKTHAGQLAGVTVAGDGALLFTDDQNGIVYRVAYGTPVPPAMTSSASATNPPVLSKAFKVTNLSTPESVLHDEEQDVYFVSNINGPPAAKDGNGFISKISPVGEIVALEFIKGLNAPKGLAIRGDELWVTDIDVIRVFQRVTGEAIRTIDVAAQGAVFLNDIAVGADDAVYVTDSDIRIKGRNERVRQGDGRIYRIYGQRVEVATAGEELRSPNGIAWDGLRFLVAQMNGQEILAWQPGSQAKAILRGPGAFDGIVVLPNGTVIVSSQHDGGLHISNGGTLEPLFAPRPSPADIGFDRKRNRLLVPSLEGDWLEVWNLPPMAAQTSSAPSSKNPTSAFKSAPPPVLSAAGSPGTSSTSH